MIALVKGQIEEKREKYLVLMTSGGVGYKVNVRPALASGKTLGQTVQFFVHSHIREDAFDLYGFETRSELDLFELLLSVSGIGPKTAQAVLASGSTQEITMAIAQGETEFFTQTPGIGVKGSQRIIVELRGKMGALGDLDLTLDQAGENKQIVEALRGFGFKLAEAQAAIRSLPKGSPLTLAEKVKAALKSLSK